MELRSLLIARATGRDYDETKYNTLRSKVLKWDEKHIPSIIKDMTNLEHFWHFIQPKFDNYKDRRSYIYQEFKNPLELLENDNLNILQDDNMFINTDNIKHEIEKSRKRIEEYPESAISSAKTLIESLLKTILDKKEVSYNNEDLPKLTKLVLASIGLDINSLKDSGLRQLAQGCISTVQAIGELRNKVSDAHGKGLDISLPKEHEARFVVNSAFSICIFLTEQYNSYSQGNMNNELGE